MFTCALLAGLLVGAIADPPLAPIVGRVIIVGNTKTADEKIHEIVNIFPGQTLAFDDMKKAEQRLDRSKLFEGARKRGIHQRITILPAEYADNIRDILIVVKELPK